MTGLDAGRRERLRVERQSVRLAFLLNTVVASTVYMPLHEAEHGNI